MFDSLLNGINKFIEGQQSDIKRHQKKIDEFNDHIGKLSTTYVDARKREVIKDYYNKLSKNISFTNMVFNLATFDTNLSKFVLFSDFDKKIDEANEKFIENELVKKRLYFKNLLDYPLDEDQQTAILTDEVNTLVVAGAGCGKTSTILGKIKYLMDVKEVKPKEILVLSFSNDSINDLNKRLKKRNIPVQGMTFHSFAHKNFASNKSIADQCGTILTKSIVQYFEGITDRKEQERVLHFFSVDLYNLVDNQEIIQDQFEDISIETIKSKIQTTKKINKNITINQEFVRSKEEAAIANFLYLNGVKYEYEKPYKFKVTDPNGKVVEYKPDFYLPEYDIYLEHFGVSLIDKNGSETDTNNYKTPQFIDSDYINEITLKRETHIKNNTKLLESYSFWNQEGKLIEKLTSLLKSNSVEFKPLDDKTVRDSFINYLIPEVNQRSLIFSQFINLFKANGYKSFNSFKNTRDKKKEFFLSIMEGIYNLYQSNLKDKIDFNDIINIGIEKVKDVSNLGLKYIIIDEFQDINKGRYNLLKELQKQTNCKIFAVGDDWQSIYRFEGSDVSLFKQFSENFGEKCSVVKIRHTYRNSQDLIDSAGEFIMRNPSQLKKTLISHAPNVLNPIIVKYFYPYKEAVAISSAIYDIVGKSGKDTDILILVRYNRDDKVYNYLKNAMKDDFIFNKDHTIRCKKYKDLKIKFMTCHKSKGLEATNVIVILTPGIWGFPNRVADNPMLQDILSEPDKCAFAEERRLFYVAITRAKKYAYIVSKKENIWNTTVTSSFAKEIQEIIFKKNQARNPSISSRSPQHLRAFSHYN